MKLLRMKKSLERSENYEADSIQRKIDKVKYEQERKAHIIRIYGM
ncbi:hypothetical protein [Oceanirhabdus seepicola]|nr:hypothetical protein [Oceanirhabdus seepicola]